MYDSSQESSASSAATPPRGLLLIEKTNRLYFESVDQLSTYIAKHRDHFDYLCRGENETVISLELTGNKKPPTDLAAQLRSVFSIPTLQQGKWLLAIDLITSKAACPKMGVLFMFVFTMSQQQVIKVSYIARKIE